MLQFQLLNSGKLTDASWHSRVAASHYICGSYRHSNIFTTEQRLTTAVCSGILQLIAANTITAVCSIHHTGSIIDSGIGKFIASSDVMSIGAVLRNSHRSLDR